MKTAPVVFDWVFTLASDSDDENNPANVWPDSREQITAGKVRITAGQRKN